MKEVVRHELLKLQELSTDQLALKLSVSYETAWWLIRKIDNDQTIRRHHEKIIKELTT